jgi:hypothetical protein
VIRVLLVLACLLFFGLCVAGMRLGWRRRAQRQDGLGEHAGVPMTFGDPLLPPMTGLYVGTTHADRWQDRVVARGLGLRATMTTTLTAQGLLIERNGAEPIFVAADNLLDVGVGAGLAGKVMGPGGMLIVRWRDTAGTELDTGLRGDDKSIYPAWVAAVDRITDHPTDQGVPA